MSWLQKQSAPLNQAPSERKVEAPDGLWEKCKKCREVFFREEFLKNLYVCPKCDFHYFVPTAERISQLVDPGSFLEKDCELTSKDPLEFKDQKPYKDRLHAIHRKGEKFDAFIAGEAKISGIDVQLGVFDFEFMGGSMGIVVGEKISRLYKRSHASGQPAVIVTSSGGARMQEGLLSLMQMAKTCAGLALLKNNGIPFLSILTNPTTGGVAASFAMLGDINIAEPGALIGFAGPRVIQQTIGQELPPGFQTSAFLLEHGMVDMICKRNELRATVGKFLNLLCLKKI